MANAKKQQIKTTDRHGPARVAFGCLLLGLGLSWSLALLMNTASSWRMLSLFRDLAHGLGGVLCAGLPLFALTGGGLLCASARRKTSPRVFLCLLGMYLCLLTILTLVTSIGTRDNTLMNYIGGNVGGTVGETSYASFLRGAYTLRSFNGGRLAGGGLLGMLLAYPIYLLLNVAGGVTLMVLIMLVLLLVMLRLNPADAISALVERSEARRAAQQPETEEEPAPAWQPTAEVPPAEPLIRPQTVQYTTTSVQTEPEANFLVEEEDLSRTPPVTPEERGFMPVPSGELYEEHIPVTDDKPRAAAKQQPAPASAEASPAQPARRTRRQRAEE
ncbi:MAG: hypothetical protein IJS53_05800, partial [Clostridia bacterium]|nr:hypothetical protein [Clostridia bacterium]